MLQKNYKKVLTFFINSDILCNRKVIIWELFPKKREVVKLC